MTAIPSIGQLNRDISATLAAQTRRFPIAISRNIPKIGNLIADGAINLRDRPPESQTFRTPADFTIVESKTKPLKLLISNGSRGFLHW